MHAIRHSLLSRPWVAAWIVALALALKLLVPTGYMIAASDGAIGIVPCSGFGPQAVPGAAAQADPGGHGRHAMPDHAMPGDMAHGQDDGARDDVGHGKTGRGKAEMPCAFAGLAAPTLAAADPLLLAAAILFILATAFRAADRPTRARAAPRLRPPPIGPPLHA